MSTTGTRTGQDRLRGARRATAVLLIAALAAVPLWWGRGSDHRPAQAATGAEASQPTGSDWPMLHRDRARLGTSEETAVATDTAADLGLRWKANTGSPVFSSPIVSWRSALSRTLVYVGNQAGTLSAYDARTGTRVWYYKAAKAIQTTPTLDGDVLYFGDADHGLYAIDADTGRQLCTFTSSGIISSSPIVVPDGNGGSLVIFGDNGSTGSDDGGHVWAITGADGSSTQCRQKWSFTNFGDPAGSVQAGSWSSPGYAVTTAGVPLIVFGSSSPDNAVYALDATTGKKVWRFQPEVFAMDNDVGASPTISAPGVNGFAKGVVYISGKNRITYALNLANGTEIWKYSVRDAEPKVKLPTRSTAALEGDTLFLGYGGGLMALDARTGAARWTSAAKGGTSAETTASPAITGPTGKRVLLTADLKGQVGAYDAVSGSRLWSYSAGGYVYGSPAVAYGRVYVGAADGYLYSFAPGAMPGTPPKTVLYTPGGSEVSNPWGDLYIGGGATDDTGVDQVVVAVKDRAHGTWWDASKGAWGRVYQENPATLGSGGSPSVSWSLSLPIPRNGGEYLLHVEAVDRDGLHDLEPVSLEFDVTAATDPPDTTITSPTFRQIFTFADSDHEIFPIEITGTATDPGGQHKGIDKVYVFIKNREHQESFCGKKCSTSSESAYWTPGSKRLTAKLSDPGAATTTWSITLDPIYNHPHSYSVTAFAVDLDGNPDPTRADVGRFCTRDKGIKTCA